MSLRNLPQANLQGRPQNFSWDSPSDALARWADLPQAATSEDANAITIFDQIGTDWWTGEGVTAKRIGAALRAIGAGKDVVVNINSPGGDMFEGIAIYNLLAAHEGKVTVNVLGLAASAASIIAMAGDTINMGAGSFLMIHNCWAVVIGNQNDLREAAELFTSFDQEVANIYHARTGLKPADIVDLMAAETWMGSADAIKRGFADGTIPDPDPSAQASAGRSTGADKTLLARRQTEGALARAGFSRSDRQQMIAALGGAQRDAGITHPAARDAGELLASLSRLASTIAS
jgi:ATP-dependent Clp protease protease subunit